MIFCCEFTQKGRMGRIEAFYKIAKVSSCLGGGWNLGGGVDFGGSVGVAFAVVHRLFGEDGAQQFGYFRTLAHGVAYSVHVDGDVETVACAIAARQWRRRRRRLGVATVHGAKQRLFVELEKAEHLTEGGNGGWRGGMRAHRLFY